jgi:hypothetical protein
MRLTGTWHVGCLHAENSCRLEKSDVTRTRSSLFPPDAPSTGKLNTEAGARVPSRQVARTQNSKALGLLRFCTGHGLRRGLFYIPSPGRRVMAALRGLARGEQGEVALVRFLEDVCGCGNVSRPSRLLYPRVYGGVPRGDCVVRLFFDSSGVQWVPVGDADAAFGALGERTGPHESGAYRSCTARRQGSPLAVPTAVALLPFLVAVELRVRVRLVSTAPYARISHSKKYRPCSDPV